MIPPPHLHLLGRVRITNSGQSVNLALKEAALLSLLAHRHPARVLRRELARLLWPQVTERTARHSLSQAIYRIRQELGTQAVEADAKTVGLGNIRCDLVRFCKALRHGDYHSAAVLYQGTFADQLSLSGCLDLEHVLDEARAHYSAKAQTILAEPLPIDVEQQLRVALGSIGVPSSSRVTRSESHRGAFVGRAAELRKLERGWQAAQARQSSVVLIEGEAGIGKSALGERFFRKTVLRGARGVQAAGHSLEANLPYGLVARLLRDMSMSGWLTDLPDPWLTILAGIQPSLCQSNGGKPVDLVPEQIAVAFQRAAQRAADKAPVSIFVDDIQWADPASLGILHYMSHKSDLPLLQLWARRTSEATIGSNAHWTVSNVVELHGLSQSEVKYLVSTRRPELADTTVANDLHLLSQGNPLLVLALLEGDLPPTSLPPSAKKYFQEQISRLPDLGKEVGAAIAVGATAMSVDIIAELTDLTEPEITEAISLLRRRGYVRKEHDGTYSFRHHLVEEVFLTAVAPAVRAGLHSRSGRLLRTQGRDPAVVATHFAIGGSAREAYQTAMTAAEGGERLHAFNESEHFYRIAVAHATNIEEEIDATTALARLLIDHTRPNEALELLERLLHQPVPQEKEPRVEVLSLLASLKGESKHLPFLQSARRQLSRLTKTAPRVLVLDTLIELGVSALECGERGFARLVASESRTFVDEMQNGAERTNAEVRLLTLSALLQRPEKIKQPLQQLTARVSTSPVAHARCLLASGIINLLHGEMDHAEASLLEALGVCEQYGLEDQRIVVANDLGVAYLEQGRWAEADQQFNLALRSARLGPRREALSVANNLAVLRWESADYEKAVKAGEYCIELGSQYGSRRSRFLGLAICGLASLEMGSLSEARYAERELRISLPVGRWWGNDISYSELLLARTAALNGRREEAIRRLRSQTRFSATLDFYCAARLEVELCRLSYADDPASTIRQATALRHKLAHAKAIPLVERIDGVITRCRAAMAE